MDTKLRLKSVKLLQNRADLKNIKEGKQLICCLNAYCYVTARKDSAYAEALNGCDVLLPDGASVIAACRFLKNPNAPSQRCPGWDLFEQGMIHMQHKAETEGRKKVMFVGSSEKTQSLIWEQAAQDYPDLEVVTLSPPYVKDFSEEQSREIIEAINAADPDLLWIGMTAPKQEKWTYQHWNELNIHCHCGCIGAVFDFYAGTVKRAPLWWQRHGLEWLHRLISEPRRMWRRYLVGNTKFLWYMLGEKFSRQ